MELVPIIYTALIVVAVITIFVISGSYISFKIRQKNDITNSSTIANSQPSHKIEQTVKNVVNRITKPLFHAEVNKEKEIKNASKNDSSKSNLIRKENNKNSAKSGRNNKLNNQSNRIVVMNNPTSVKKNDLDNNFPQSTSSEEKISNFKSLNDDLIEKYADGNKETMFMLNMKNSKDNKKK